VVNTPQKKSDESPHILKSLAMAETERLTIECPRAVQIYTDGSLNPETGRAGASAIFPTTGISHEARISDFASTLTTELMGIDLALKASSGSDVVIHTDSLNAIRNIADHDPQNSLAVSIQAQLVDREHSGNRTTLHWVPSHVDIPGN
jgi:ribonuclease HI